MNKILQRYPLTEGGGIGSKYLSLVQHQGGVE